MKRNRKGALGLHYCESGYVTISQTRAFYVRPMTSRSVFVDRHEPFLLHGFAPSPLRSLTQKGYYSQFAHFWSEIKDLNKASFCGYSLPHEDTKL